MGVSCVGAVVRWLRINGYWALCPSAVYLLCKAFMNNPLIWKGVQDAGRFLPDDVRLMSLAKECCSIEINDPDARMVLDALFSGLRILCP